MTYGSHSTAALGADVGRWLLIAAGTLILCSCQGPQKLTSVPPDPMAAVAQVANERPAPVETVAQDTNSAPSPIAPVGYNEVTNASVPVAQDCPPAVPQAMVQVQPNCPGGAMPHDLPAYQPYTPCPNGLPCGAWTPPGLPCPWPLDEYLCDGGDKLPAVNVRKDWSVDGLALEDTVVHYDTIDGDTHVEPTNRVCLYAPRFAAVRKVYGIAQHETHQRLAGTKLKTPPLGVDDVQSATTAIQPVQPELNMGTKTASGFRERVPPTVADNAQGLTGMHGGLLPFEDSRILHGGVMDNSEKARLAERVEAAVVWSHDSAVQVVIDNVAAEEDVGLSAANSVHTYSLMGKPRLQVCKTASRKDARPGETVDFAIEFKNVGDQVIGNVTVIDNLTTRLEYVEGSATCTLDAKFSSADNEGDSLVLRWEIVEPMKVNEGGVIRFTCRVR